MAIKKLQNNFTTPEQSKRLFKLGVPEWTADCYYYEEGGISKDCTPDIVSFGEVWTDESMETAFSSYVDVPCWSVGRLIEIAHICSDSTLSYKEEANEIQKFKEEHKCETLIEAVIVCIADAVSIGSINFSKLEDEL